MNLVLEALTAAPFEPLQDVSLKFMSYKVVFLVAITPARRISELQALWVDPPYLNFHYDKVVLRTNPRFLPKVVSPFHINLELVLPSLCPNPGNGKEAKLHTLDLVRALKIYVERTAEFRCSKHLSHFRWEDKG